LTPFPAPLFTNALLIPTGYGTDGFRPDEAPRPLERATNAGFLIVTIEFDCQGPEQFEENMIWIRSPDGDGDFARSPFAELGRDLQRVKEYRGFSIAFSGNRSLHFHFVFSTEHLQNVPSGAVAGDRLADFREGVDELAELVKEELKADPPPGRADRVKLVFWDGTGLCLLAERLEGGKFRWSPSRTASRGGGAIGALIDGLDWPRVHARRVVDREGAENCRAT
jgi:transposase